MWCPIPLEQRKKIEICFKNVIDDVSSKNSSCPTFLSMARGCYTCFIIIYYPVPFIGTPVQSSPSLMIFSSASPLLPCSAPVQRFPKRSRERVGKNKQHTMLIANLENLQPQYYIISLCIDMNSKKWSVKHVLNYHTWAQKILEEVHPELKRVVFPAPANELGIHL